LIHDEWIDPAQLPKAVEYQSRRSPRRGDVRRYRHELRALGGTGGFLREDDPDTRWREDFSADARLLSIDNSMS